MLIPRRVLLVFCCLAAAAPLMAAPERWQWLSPGPTVYQINDLVGHAGTHYGATAEGHVVASADGTAWSRVFDGDLLHPLRRIKVLAGALYAIGDRGRILRSIDGQAWTGVHRSSQMSLRGIVHTGAEFVAISAMGEILRSSDGIVWRETPSTSVQDRPRIADLAFGNGVFVATYGDSLSDASARCLRSLDGTAWTEQVVPTITVEGYAGGLAAIDFAIGRFVAVGGRHNICVSVDGVSWTTVGSFVGVSGTAPKVVRYLNGTWYVGGAAGLLIGTDNGWARVGYVDAFAISYGGGRFVSADTSGAFAQSMDGRAWTSSPTAVTNQRLTSVVRGLGKFYIGGGYGLVYSSADGLSWNSAVAASQTIMRMYGDSSLIIAVGFGGSVTVGTADGNWRQHQLGSPDTVWRQLLRWRGRYYVFGPSTFAYSSEDAVSWNRLDFPPGFNFAVAAASNTVLLIGGTSSTLHSSDGENFTQHPAIPGFATELGYFKGEFYAVLDHEAISHSPDGLTWSPPINLAWSYRGSIQSSLMGDVYASSRISAIYINAPIGVIDGTMYIQVGPGTLASANGRDWHFGNLPFATAATDGTRIVSVGGTGAIAVRRAAMPGSLANISVRTRLPDNGNPLILGTVVSGGPRSMLVRVAASGLRQHGVELTAEDPVLALYHRGVAGASNDDWDVEPNLDALRQRTAELGAAPFAGRSKEPALVASFPPGATTVHVWNLSGPSGVGLAEVYAGPAMPSAAGAIVNMSARSVLREGEGVLITGFVVADGKATVLLRGIGPALVGQGVADAVGATRLDVYRSGTLIASNEGWTGGVAGNELAFYQRLLGAFPLTSGSRDSALILQLEPGAYTAVLRSPGGEIGSGMTELYLVTP